MAPPTEVAEKRTAVPRRRRWRWLRWVVAAVLLLVAVLWGITFTPPFKQFLTQAIIWGPNTNTTVDLAADPAPDQLRQRGIDHQFRVSVGPPAASLLVWVIDPKVADGSVAATPRGTIMLLHGIRDQKGSMVGVGQMLAKAGYRAVLPDSRAHGRSTGQWLTFGVVESQDLVQLLDELDNRNLLAQPVGAYGMSYGAATALQLAGRDPRVRAVVTVAAFQSMRDVVPVNLRYYLPLPGWLMTSGQMQDVISRAGVLGQFDPDEASPLKAIGRTRAQVLLIHGLDDPRIPASHSQALHAAALDHSALLLLAGETHNSIAQDRHGIIAHQMVAWFDRWLSATPQPDD